MGNLVVYVYNINRYPQKKSIGKKVIILPTIPHQVFDTTLIKKDQKKKQNLILFQPINISPDTYYNYYTLLYIIY